MCGLRLHEAEIVLLMLKHPTGISARGIRGGTGLSLDLISERMVRLINARLVDYFYGAFNGLNHTFYFLLVAGWLKAVTLERPHSSKERIQACEA